MSNSLDELKKVMDFIHVQTQGMAVPTGRRELIVLGCFDIAVEHAAGITILADRQTWAPAFALLRPLLDSYVRGVWLAICATDEQLALFETNELRHTVQFRHMVEAIEAEVEAKIGPSDLLSTLRKTGWNLMSDFTHTGYEHVTRRLSALHLGANYPPEEIEQALWLTGALALLAAIITADVAKKAEVVTALQTRAKEFASTRLTKPLSANSLRTV
jgi:hypothetical protein